MTRKEKSLMNTLKAVVLHILKSRAPCFFCSASLEKKKTSKNMLTNGTIRVAYHWTRDLFIPQQIYHVLHFTFSEFIFIMV